ncbi:MAG: hypothetical protein ABI947_13380 [Chloroflexota bacterium]
MMRERLDNKNTFGFNHKGILFVVSLGSIVYFIAIVFVIPWFKGQSYPNETTFCTTNDKVYQAINNNLSQWLQYFPAEDYVFMPPEKELLKFSIVNGNQYTVQAGLWTYTSSSRKFLVTVDNGIGPSVPREGVRGYLFVQDGQLPPLSQKYDSLQLDKNIFCYWIRGTEPNLTSIVKEN